MLDVDLLFYLDGLFRYAVILSHDRTQAEDLVQETYARAIAAVGSLRPNSNVKSWLFTILRNIWLNELRQQRSSPKATDTDGEDRTSDLRDDSASDPHAAYVAGWQRDRVRAAIRGLPVHFREIIVLREYEELSYAEIARMLNCPVGTVMSRLARARSQLRDLLSDPSELSSSGVEPDIRQAYESENRPENGR